ncbi:MAG: hypothetical protein U9O94_04350 [Nanoarchaeota archaeon]|nr:hypothetical protein [Nanoarchaeota archaeon]
MTIPSVATFSITSATEVIAAPGAGNYIHIVGIAFDNDDVDSDNNTKVRLQDGSGGTDLYGGSTSSIYTPGKGGFFDLRMSYSHPYWDLSANTALYITPSSSIRVNGTVWYYTDTNATVAPSHETFDISANTSVISAVADQTIKVIGLSIHNNSSDDENVHLTDGNAGTDLYGGANGAFYLINKGGTRQLGMSYDNPYFELTTNTALYIKPTNSKTIGGVVWYIQS